MSSMLSGLATIIPLGLTQLESIVFLVVLAPRVFLAVYNSFPLSVTSDLRGELKRDEPATVV